MLSFLFFCVWGLDVFDGESIRMPNEHFAKKLSS